jgi:hypothetical protein
VKIDRFNDRRSKHELYSAIENNQGKVVESTTINFLQFTFIHIVVQNLASGNVGALDSQQSQSLSKQGMCKHKLESQSRQILCRRSEPTDWLAFDFEVKRDAARELNETGSCKDEDADACNSQILNHDVYNV